MRINIELKPGLIHANDVLALKALVDALAQANGVVGLPEGFDRGTGSLKKFDPTQVTIWSTEENGEIARQRVNLDDSVEDVELKTIPKGHPKKDEVVVDCCNSMGLKQDAEPKKETPKKSKKGGTKNAQTDIAKATEAVVNVKTNDVEVDNATIEDALDELDPPKPESKKIDHAAELRKLMVEVVKQHGPAGAKLASQVVNKIAGVKDVTKIPAEKFDAVKAGLLAAIEAKNDDDDLELPSTKAVDKKPDEVDEPSVDLDDVDC